MGDDAERADAVGLPEVTMQVSFRTQTPQRRFLDAGDGLPLLKNKRFLRRYAKAFAEAHGQDRARIEELLDEAVETTDPTEWIPLPWWWAEFFREIRRLKKSKGEPQTLYELGIKACSDYYFYSLRAASAEVPGASGARRGYLYAPFFQPSEPPPKGKDDQARLRGLVDQIILLGSSLRHVDDLVEFLRWFDIRLICDVTLESTNLATFRISRTQLGPSRSIETPGKPVLVASPNVRTAIAGLEEAWLNKRARSVLVSAWTGSGKEVLVELLSHAVRGRVHQIAAPGTKFADLQAQMAHKKDDLGLRPVSTTPGPPDGAGEAPRDRAVLFLDEIHHEESHDVRTGLLRVLETRQISDGSAQLDCSHVLWVLAASEPPEALRVAREPRDLWNRVEYTVTVRHPLQIENRIARKETLEAYFDMFWTAWQEEWKEDWIGNSARRLKRLVLGDPTAEVCRRRFVEELSSPLIPLVSIRELRTITMRLFGRQVTWFRTGNGPKGLEDKVSDWLSEIAAEVLTEADPRGAF